MNSLSKLALTLSIVAAVSMPTNSRALLQWHSALDGDATAKIGTDGVATGAPVATADRDGNPDGAVLFNGSTDYFDIGPLGPFSAGTISAWVRSDDNATERGAVAAGATGGGASVYFSFMNQAGGEIRVDLDDGAARRDAQGGGAQVLGQWYHVAATFVEEGTLRLYIDGNEVNTQSLAGDNAPYAMSNNGLIGTERTGSRFWMGAIDDVRIYDHELSAAEVMTLFTNGPLYDVDPTDSDGDGMGDEFEQMIIDADGGDAINTLADVLPGDDFDADGSLNEEEEDNNTDPTDPDTDADGYQDGVETNDGTFDDINSDTGTDPRDRDTDDDGLDDGVETNDGTFDDINTDTGTNPLDDDTDGDIMDDGYELDNQLDPLVDDAGLDPDNDMSTNVNEFNVGTDPQNPDSDGDGYKDGIETDDGTFDDINSDTGTDPLDPDTDGDGLPDGVETNDGTFDDASADTGSNPHVVDTDGDNFSDGSEVNLHSTDPNNAASIPGTGLQILYIGGNANGNQAADDEVIAFLGERYGLDSVTYQQATASNAGDEDGFDLLILSSTPGSVDFRGKFHNSTVPIVNWEEAVVDNSENGEFGISSEQMTKSTTTTEIVMTGHPIGLGLPAQFAFTTGNGPETTATNQLFPGLASAGNAGNGTGTAGAGNGQDITGYAMLLVAEAGDAVDPGAGVTDNTTPARRVMFPMTDGTFNGLTAEGRTLFTNAIDWAVGRLGQGQPDRITRIVYDDTSQPGNILVELTFTSSIGKTYAIYTSTDFSLPALQRADVDDSVPGDEDTTTVVIDFNASGIPLTDKKRFFVVVENEN